MAEEIRIVIVDDDIDFLIQTELLLKSSGMVIRGFNRPISSWRYMRQSLPHLILLDLDMPEMSGFDLLNKIRSHSATSRIPVILLTGHSGQDLVTEGFQAGLDDFIHKPFDGEELILRIRVVVNRYLENNFAHFNSGFPTEQVATGLLDNYFSSMKALQDPHRLLIVQIPESENMLAGDGRNIFLNYQQIAGKLVHRIVDLVSSNNNLSGSDLLSVDAGRGLLITIVKNISHEKYRPPCPSRLVKMVKAGNRLLRKSCNQKYYLAGDATGNLKRRKLPGLRIFDVDFSLRDHLNTEMLLNILEYDLNEECTGENVYHLLKI